MSFQQLKTKTCLTEEGCLSLSECIVVNDNELIKTNDAQEFTQLCDSKLKGFCFFGKENYDLPEITELVIRCNNGSSSIASIRNCHVSIIIFTF